jgi:hypothetical protein
VPDTKGYWISPGGDVLEVPEHFEAVREAPAAFGFTEEEAQEWKRADRESVLRKVIARGWIRVRGHRNHTTFEIQELDQNSAFSIRSFLVESGAWPQETVEVHELGPGRQLREDAAFFLEDRHLALLGMPSERKAEDYYYHTKEDNDEWTVHGRRHHLQIHRSEAPSGRLDRRGNDLLMTVYYVDDRLNVIDLQDQFDAEAHGFRRLKDAVEYARAKLYEYDERVDPSEKRRSRKA